MTTADTYSAANARTVSTPGFGLAFGKWAREDGNVPLYVILVLAMVWIAAISVWGLPALYLPAVAVGPLMLVVLVALTRG